MLLFLDFDGVTHPITGSTFNADCLAMISHALEGYSIQIVISSSWRETHDLEELLELLGPEIGGLVVGVTPVIDDPFLRHVRYHEVQKYLSDNNQDSQSWIALDDTRGFYPEDAPVIWCNPRTGVTLIEAVRLREVLAELSAE